MTHFRTTYPRSKNRFSTAEHRLIRQAEAGPDEISARVERMKSLGEKWEERREKSEEFQRRMQEEEEYNNTHITDLAKRAKRRVEDRKAFLDHDLELKHLPDAEALRFRGIMNKAHDIERRSGRRVEFGLRNGALVVLRGDKGDIENAIRYIENSLRSGIGRSHTTKESADAQRARERMESEAQLSAVAKALRSYDAVCKALENPTPEAVLAVPKEERENQWPLFRKAAIEAAKLDPRVLETLKRTWPEDENSLIEIIDAVAAENAEAIRHYPQEWKEKNKGSYIVKITAIAEKNGQILRHLDPSDFNNAELTAIVTRAVSDEPEMLREIPYTWIADKVNRKTYLNLFLVHAVNKTWAIDVLREQARFFTEYTYEGKTGVEAAVKHVLDENPGTIKTIIDQIDLRDWISKSFPKLFDERAVELVDYDPRLVRYIHDEDVLDTLLQQKPAIVLQHLPDSFKKRRFNVITGFIIEGKIPMSAIEHLPDDWKIDPELTIIMLNISANTYNALDTSLRSNPLYLYLAKRSKEAGKGDFDWEALPPDAEAYKYMRLSQLAINIQPRHLSQLFNTIITKRRMPHGITLEFLFDDLQKNDNTPPETKRAIEEFKKTIIAMEKEKIEKEKERARSKPPESPKTGPPTGTA